MQLSVKGLGLAFGVLWGACILLLGLGNLMWPGYGRAVLDLAASIYPGFHPDGGFAAVLVGTGYGLVDGFIGGAVFAWLYNRSLPATRPGPA
jgi:hypothetical protein